MSPAEQNRDHQRVDGATDQAKTEVRPHAVKHQAEATAPKPPMAVSQEQRDAARLRTSAADPASAVEASRLQQVERPSRTSL